MGLFSSIFGSKKKSTSKTDQTTTPIIPDWIQSPIQGYTNQIAALGNTNPYDWVAPASDLQNKAFAGADELGSRSEMGDFGSLMTAFSGLSAAPSYSASTGTAQSLLTNLDKYMSPYRDQVVNSAIADWDFNAGQAQAQADLDIASSVGFGGSGAALAKSMLGDSLARGRQSTVANLYDKMFTTGAGLSADDASRRQQMEVANMEAANRAAEFNAQQEAARLDRMLSAGRSLFDQSTAYDANTRANLDTLAQLGETQRGITQEQISAPITLLGTQTALTSGLPLAMFGGQRTVGTGTTTQTSTPSLAQIAGQAAQIAAMFSDERLKTDIERVGELPNGLGIYEYRYIWGGPRQRGVMAQEVINIKPEAVFETESGHLMVDYGAL